MMIRKIIFCALSLLVLLSCTQGDGDGMTDRHRTVTLHLSVSGFDGMESRAVTSFAKGATMYLDFRGMRTVATYDGTHWEMECPDGLAETTQGFCSVFYINNPKTVGSDRVEMSSGSIVYSAKNATYTNTIEKMDISATLKPEKSRLHFRGEPGTKITVSGVAYAESFSRQDYTVTDSSSPLSLTVAADGYTPYIYVSMLADRKLVVVNGDEGYSRVFDSAVMRPGHSGYIDIPTDTSHDGWTIQQIPDTDISGEEYGEEQNWNPKEESATHEAVDLGLSVKWATCNVGADNPEDYGDYFAWGETKGYNDGKTTFSWSNYKYMQEGYSDWKHVTKYTTNDGWTEGCWYEGDTYVGTIVNSVTYKNITELDSEDDVAHVKWGGFWRMPTRAEQDELRSKCTWTWTTQNGVNGRKVTGPNGNSIFLPAAGCLDFSNQYVGLCGAGSIGFYWSLSLNESRSSYAYDLYFRSDYMDRFVDDRRCGFSVRPICP